MDQFTMLTSHGPLTESEVLERDFDMVPKLLKAERVQDFKNYLDMHRETIEALVSRHLGIDKSEFILSPVADWICGGFNICLPIDISSKETIHRTKLPQTALIRFVLPSEVGEDFAPGVVDEKVRCEAANYIWLRSACPAVPIPRLLGMGFPGTQSFTAIENESLWHRIIWQMRRSWAYLHGHTLSPFFAHQRSCLSDVGYLLLEWIEEGRMLSSTWDQNRHDERHRVNLYRGLAKIMVNLSHVPLPRIGSWTMNDHGVISLTNRPLLDLTPLWARHHIPTNIPRNTTYSSAQPFIHDLLRYHDQRMRHQLNSILDKRDGVYQLSTLVALRNLVPRYWNSQTNNGPFVPSLIDHHQSNIFVDEEWNITRLIDLEFMPVLPRQMAHVPYWLSGQGVEDLNGPHLDEYKALYDEFTTILEEQEEAGGYDNSFSRGLREMWETGSLWFSRALGSVNAFPFVFDNHLQKRFYDDFNLDTDGLTLTKLWDENAMEFIESKRADKKIYEERIHEIFAKARARAAEQPATADVKDESNTFAPKP